MTSDLVYAYKWTLLSAPGFDADWTGGDETAVDILEELASELTPEELEKAERLAEEFRPHAESLDD